MTQPTRFAIVGAGWRAEFYFRIAQRLPSRMSLVGVVARRTERAAQIRKNWNLRTYSTLDDLLAHESPEFVVTCVPWDQNPGLVRELAQRGMPVLSETPPAAEIMDMAHLWKLAQEGARVQVAEQYTRQPHHAARLAFIERGLLGTVSQAQVSACHGYHGTSLIRHYLGIDMEPVSIRATSFQAPLIAGPGRDGPPTEERTTQSQQTIAWLSFPEKLGVYDFSGDQYFSWVRNERLLVRGERGEIIDQSASYLEAFDRAFNTTFRREVAGANGNLEGHHLKGITAAGQCFYVNHTAPARLSDDEIAIASLLVEMGSYIDGGPEPYSLAQACQDRYLDLLIARAVETGETVVSQPQPWQ